MDATGTRTSLVLESAAFVDLMIGRLLNLIALRMPLPTGYATSTYYIYRHC